MALAKEKPLFEVQTDYEDDGYAWCYEQAELLRQRRFTEIDLPNIIQEFEDMGSERRRVLMSSFRVLMIHLMKWEFQSEKRTNSWLNTITRERANIESRLEESPSLTYNLDNRVAAMYLKARRHASIETDLDLETFPETRPYSLQDIQDLDFFPGPEGRPE